MKEKSREFKKKIEVLPSNPGIYFFLNEEKEIIYIGKAKSLKNRVKSYFTGSHNLKTQKLVQNIFDIEFTAVNNATEALVLENIQIKKHKPKYNILLKDDKTYPYVKITKEEYPRVISVRKKEKDGAKYFGPFPSEGIAKVVVEAINETFPLVKLKNCGKREPCLYYYTKSCLAPCAFTVDKKNYNEMIKKTMSFLNGDHKVITNVLEERMSRASENLNFELASELRDKINKIKQIKEKQNIIIKDGKDMDIVNYNYENGLFCGVIMHIKKGTLFDVYQDVFGTHLNDEEAFRIFIEQFYLNNEDNPKIIYVPLTIDSDLLGLINLKFLVPKKGEKKKLLEMAGKNAKLNLKKYLVKEVTKQRETVDSSKELANFLNIEKATRIECFDNSNIQGAYNVSAMVVFENGKPLKKDYRKYKIKTVEKSDDVAMMKEVTKRRYERLKKESLQKPDLILIDGGKNQLKIVFKVLQELDLESIPVFGVVKDEKHKTDFVIDIYGRKYKIKEQRELYGLITRIQDEVHRFAIAFYRKTHLNKLKESILDDITGVGKKRKRLLYKHFGSLKNMIDSPIEEYVKIGIPLEIANKIKNKLNKK